MTIGTNRRPISPRTALRTWYTGASSLRKANFYHKAYTGPPPLVSGTSRARRKTVEISVIHCRIAIFPLKSRRTSTWIGKYVDVTCNRKHYVILNSGVEQHPTYLNPPLYPFHEVYMHSCNQRIRWTHLVLKAAQLLNYTPMSHRLTFFHLPDYFMKNITFNCW